jgi:hypothetical protein
MRTARVARKLTRRRLSNCRIAATPRVKRAANIGYFVLGEVPHTMMVLGASIIVLSGLYAFYRERIRHREVAASASGLPPDGL